VTSDLCPTCGGAVRPSTVCVCGLAKSYHRRTERRDHEYERRYFAALPADRDEGLEPCDCRMHAPERFAATPAAGIDVERDWPAIAKALFKEIPTCTGCDFDHGWDDHVRAVVRDVCARLGASE
jgi:hypothetical protein